MTWIFFLAETGLTLSFEGKRFALMACICWARNYRAPSGRQWQRQVKQGKVHLLPKVRFKVLPHLKQRSRCIRSKVRQIVLHWWWRPLPEEFHMNANIQTFCGENNNCVLPAAKKRSWNGGSCLQYRLCQKRESIYFQLFYAVFMS